MEFDIVNTPCPAYKTLKRRYTILVFSRVNIKLIQKQNVVKQEKISFHFERSPKIVYCFVFLSDFAKASSDVLYPQIWPYSFLCLTRAQREVKYEELTLAEFGAGYVQILLCKDISHL